MIVTLTPNPSVDRTVALTSRLERHAVLRAESVISQAGGKGVNISRAAVSADIPVVGVVNPGARAAIRVPLQRHREELVPEHQHQLLHLGRAQALGDLHLLERGLAAGLMGPDQRMGLGRAPAPGSRARDIVLRGNTAAAGAWSNRGRAR